MPDAVHDNVDQTSTVIDEQLEDFSSPSKEKTLVVQKVVVAMLSIVCVLVSGMSVPVSRSLVAKAETTKVLKAHPIDVIKVSSGTKVSSKVLGSQTMVSAKDDAIVKDKIGHFTAA